MSDQELEALWKQLGDVPCDDNGMLLEQWREWQSGTDRELIWHWFDRSHSAGVVALMFPVEVGGLPIVRKEYSDCQKVVLRLL